MTHFKVRHTFWTPLARPLALDVSKEGPIIRFRRECYYMEGTFCVLYVQMSNIQSRRWCFTLNNPSLEESAEFALVCDSDVVRYACYGDELGEEGTPHIQGFVIFNKPVRLSGVKKLLLRAHWEKTMGTSEQAATYCKKDGKFVEFGEIPLDTKITSAMLKEKWAHAIACAKEGKFDEIAPDLYLRYRNNIHAIYDDACTATECIDALDHLWIVGGSGIGKSRYCWQTFPGAYRKALNKWWCHFSNEKVVIVEDVDPSHEKWLGSFLKIWSDHYPYIAERKGGSRLIRPEKIVVTSNYTIGQVFKESGIKIPLLRRFKTGTIKDGLLVEYRDDEFLFERIGADHYRHVE